MRPRAASSPRAHIEARLRRRPVEHGRSEGGEELRDGGRVRDDGASDESTAASGTYAKVCVEGSLQQGSPVDACGRCVQLALENALPVRAPIERTFGATCSALPVIVSDEVTTASTASRRKTARPSPACDGGAPPHTSRIARAHHDVEVLARSPAGRSHVAAPRPRRCASPCARAEHAAALRSRRGRART